MASFENLTIREKLVIYRTLNGLAAVKIVHERNTRSAPGMVYSSVFLYSVSSSPSSYSDILSISPRFLFFFLLILVLRYFKHSALQITREVTDHHKSYRPP